MSARLAPAAMSSATTNGTPPLRRSSSFGSHAVGAASVATAPRAQWLEPEPSHRAHGREIAQHRHAADDHAPGLLDTSRRARRACAPSGGPRRRGSRAWRHPPNGDPRARPPSAVHRRSRLRGTRRTADAGRHSRPASRGRRPRHARRRARGPSARGVCSGSHWPHNIRATDPRRLSSSTSEVLPTPASPEITTRRPSPRSAAAMHSSSAESSASRSRSCTPEA